MFSGRLGFALARAVVLIVVGCSPALADPHGDLVAEIQKRCDDTRGSYEPVNCQAIIIEASTAFRGVAGTASLGLLRAADPARRRGAVVLVAGFSPQASQACASESKSEDFDNWVVRGGQRGNIEEVAELWQMGFDVYSIEWCDRNDYIQRNAYILMDALEQVRQGDFPSGVAPLGEGEKLVLIGYSMGGLVSRYALTSLEDDGLDHGVDLFISFDAPQEGAYLPIGIQHLAELIDIGPAIGVTAARVFNKIKGLIKDGETPEDVPCDTGLEETLCKLRGAETPAARQMLLVHKDGPLTSAPTEDFEELFEELDALGYPDADGMRTVAIANGSGTGQWTDAPVRTLRLQLSDEQKKTIHLQFPADAEGTLTDPILWEGTLRFRAPSVFEMRVVPLNQANTTMTVFEARINTPGFYINDVFVTAGQIDVGLIRGLLGLPDELPAKTILSPAVQTIRDIVDSLLDPTAILKVERRANVPVAYATVSAGTSSKFQETADGLSKLRASGGADAEPFIPTTSALGLNRDDYPAHTDVAKLDEAGILETPFDQIYYHNRETAHIEHTNQAVRWLCDEVSGVAQAPRITALTPAKRPVGGATFLLTAEGQHLHDDLVLVWMNESTGETVELTTARRGDTLLAEVSAELIDELPPCSGEVCNPLFPEHEPIYVGIKDTVTEAPGCRPLRFFIEESRVTSSPATPIGGEPFTLTLSDDWRNGCSPQPIPADRPYQREGNTLTIETSTGPPEQNCTFELTAYQIETAIDPLPQGAYEAVYNVVDTGQSRELARYPFIVRAGRPVISQLEPPSVQAMPDSDVTLTVAGSGFTEASMILYDGEEQPTAFIDANTLETTLPTERLASPGAVEITVGSEDSAGTFLSEPATLTITDPLLEATELSLTELSAGAADTTVVITGQGFTPSSTASLPIGEDELLPLKTTFLSTTELAVVMPAEAAGTPGSLVIIVQDGESETSIPVRIVSDAPLVSDLPTIHAVTDAAAFRALLSPHAFATVFGADLAASEVFATSLPLPAELGGVEVAVNGMSAPVQYVSPTQINFQVPGALVIGETAQVVVSRDGLPGESFELQAVADAFGLFRYVRAAGTPDESVDPIIVDTSGRILSADNRANPNDIVVAYGTGVSSLHNPPADGLPSAVDPPATCSVTPTVTVRTDQDSAPVDVLYCGLTANFVSLIQLNLQLTRRPAGDDPRLFVRFGDSEESPGAPLYFID